MSQPTSSLLIRHESSGAFREPAVKGYAGGEKSLQELLHLHPTLLPGVEGTPVVCREFQSGAGPADVLVLHGEGDLVIVECKLATNAQVRREIVGQVVDYASRIWRMPIEEFESRWRLRTGKGPFGDFGDAAKAVRQTVAERLQSGQFTVVLAVDGINDDLQRMVEYLNAITLAEVEVLAFELARVEDHGVEILLPRVFGAELVAKKRADVQVSWPPEQVMDWLHRHSPDRERAAAEHLLREAGERGIKIDNGTAQSPSLLLGSMVNDKPLWAVSLFTEGKYPLSVRFWLEKVVDRGLDPRPAAELLARIPGSGVDLSTLAGVSYRKWIHIPLASFESADARRLLLDALAGVPGQPPTSDREST